MTVQVTQEVAESELRPKPSNCSAEPQLLQVTPSRGMNPDPAKVN